MAEDHRIQTIITAYLSGKATQEEFHELEKWVSADPENQRQFEETRNIWQIMNPAFSPADIDIDSAERKITANMQPAGKPLFKQILVYWQRGAAILIIPLLILCSYFLFNNQEINDTSVYQEVKSPHGTFSLVNLPDGTSVWLNGGSTLKYPQTFQKGQRDVYLSGEGYFEVHSDKQNPFIVKTDQITLTATGTAFNIEAYETDSLTAVTMVNGIIDVSFDNSSPILMKPGERASFNNQSKSCRIIQTDSYKWYAWKDGLMIFRDDPLSYVFKRLEQTFNVDIELKDPELANAPYRATFEYESLDEILSLLEMSAPIRFKQDKRAKNQDNTYQKLKIEVYKRKI